MSDPLAKLTFDDFARRIDEDSRGSVVEIIIAAESRGLVAVVKGVRITSGDVYANANRFPLRPIGSITIRPGCLQCDSTGRIAHDPCARCSGTGIGSSRARKIACIP